jgi:hypothetical protein
VCGITKLQRPDCQAAFAGFGEEDREESPSLVGWGEGGVGKCFDYFSNSTLTVFGFADSAFGKRTSSTPFL